MLVSSCAWMRHLLYERKGNVINTDSSGLNIFLGSSVQATDPGYWICFLFTWAFWYLLPLSLSAQEERGGLVWRAQSFLSNGRIEEWGEISLPLRQRASMAAERNRGLPASSDQQRPGGGAQGLTVHILTLFLFCLLLLHLGSHPNWRLDCTSQRVHAPTLPK